MTVEHLSDLTCRNISEFLIAFRTTGQIKQEVFDVARSAAQDLARALKGSETIPRAALHEIYGCAKVLQAEAEYSSDPATINTMAMQMQFIAELIIWGESPDDHVPGVPRP